MEQLVLESLDELRHEQGYLRIVERCKLLNCEYPDFDVAKLSVKQGESLLRQHILCKGRGLKSVVAHFYLVMVSEVDQSNEDWQFVNEIALLDHFLHLDFVCFLGIQLHRISIKELLHLLEDFRLLL